jgi:hypothetical protein
VDRSLRELFVSLDQTRDGRLCALDLLRAFGGGDGPGSSSSDGVLSEKQVEDLLNVINTGPQLLMNGKLSIGVDEFRAWMGRGGLRSS